MVEIQWPHIKDNTRTRAGCSKSLSSKAAGESKPEAYPLGYVEDFDEPRTTLADFFSSLHIAYTASAVSNSSSPVMFGWIEQRNSYRPGRDKLNRMAASRLGLRNTPPTPRP